MKCVRAGAVKESKKEIPVLEGWDVGFLQRRYFTRLLVVRLVLVLRFMTASVDGFTCLSRKAATNRRPALVDSSKRPAIKRGLSGLLTIYPRTRKELSV